MLQKYKTLFACAFALSFLIGSPPVSAQSFNGPGVNITSGQGSVRPCQDVNDIACINAGSRAQGAPDIKAPASKDKAMGEIEKYRSNMNDSTEVDGILRATTFCLGPNGERIPNRGTIELYFFDKSANCEANKEIRQCIAGVLTGTASFASCEPFQNCSGPGYNLNHGQSGTFSNAPRAANCQTAQRTCNDGTLTGNTSLTYAGTCTPFRGCTHQGVNIAHGSSAVFYRVNQSNACSTERTTVSCNDGTVSGQNLSYAFTTCAPPPSNCTFRGVTINHGQSRAFYRNASSNSCQSESAMISCNNGVISGPTTTHMEPGCNPPPIVSPPSGETGAVCAGDVIHPISLIDAQDGIGVEYITHGFHSTALNKTFIPAHTSSYGNNLSGMAVQSTSPFHFSRLRSGSPNSQFAGPPAQASQINGGGASIMFPGAPITGLEVFKHSGFAGYSGANAQTAIEQFGQFSHPSTKALVQQYRAECSAPIPATTAKLYCGWYAYYDDIGLGSGAGSMREGYCTFENHYTSAKTNWVPEPTCQGPDAKYIYSWNAGMCDFALSYRTREGGGYPEMVAAGQNKFISLGFVPGRYYELSSLGGGQIEMKRSASNTGCRLDATPVRQQYIFSGEGQGPVGRQGEVLELTCDLNHLNQIKTQAGQRITTP